MEPKNFSAGKEKNSLVCAARPVPRGSNPPSAEQNCESGYRVVQIACSQASLAK
jgi:hypothetical protein